jgi:hypothetical protein
MIQGELLYAEIAFPFLRLSAISSGVSRRKRDRTEGAGEDAEPLAAGARFNEPGAVDVAADTAGPAIVWRDRDGKRDTGAWFTTLARRSNARAKLMAN